MSQTWEHGARSCGRHGADCTTPTDPGEIALRLAHDRAYLAELHARVAEAVEQGKSVEETAVACGAMTYRREDENRGAHQLNAESAFVELGGTSPAAPVGWDRMAEG